MSTRHKLVGERVNNPSKQQIRRIVGKAETLDGFTMRPGYLYTVVRAISARVNQNYDGWPSDELKKSYKTFIGKPVFVNHENYDPTKARGVVVAARYVEAGQDKYIEVIQEIDAKRFPILAHEIRTGGLDSVSMGAEAGFTICSYCGNKAQDVPDMCDHVLFHKGEKLSRFNRKTGRREEVLIYESCHKLSFFELSYVFDPADETAVASKVLVASNGDNQAVKKSAFAMDVLRTAGFHVHSAECPPGKDCTVGGDPAEQITPDSANNPLNGGGAGPASGGSAPIAPDTSAVPGQPASPAAAGGIPLTQKPDGTWTSSDPAWAHLINRESGGNPSITQQIHDVNSGGNEAQGLFQITPQTWKANGGIGDNPGKATPQQQAEVAKAIFTKNPSGSDWGAGLSGREDASALAKGFSPTTTQTTVAPTQQTPTQPAQKAANRRVADKCHYCAGDAEEGRSSCSAHSKMEDQKFKAAVLQAFRKGAPFAEYTDFDDCTSKNSDKGDADAYCGEIKHRTEDKKESMKSFESRVLAAAGLKNAGGAHRQQTGPKHQAPFGYSPKDMPGQYQVMDGAEFAKQYDERQKQGDPEDMVGGPKHRAASFEARVLQAWGETEAPAAVDTMREEGSAPEDDNNDFYHYVEPPKELQTPDLSQAAQLDREQDENGQAGMDGVPGPNSPDAGMGGPPQPQQQFMELKIPIPQQGQAGAPNAPAMPMQPYQDQPPAPMPPGPPMGGPPAPPGPPQQQVAASTRAYFDRYFGKTSGLQTLGNRAAVSTTSRNPMKGTANMAGNTLASRGKTVTAGRRQHFAEGPLVDTGDQSRNDQGEQEEVFLSQTPPPESVEVPKDGQEISNTENNLVARVQKGRAQLLADAQKLAALRARRTAGEAGGPVATEVDPQVNTGPGAEELTGDDFESANPNEGVVETQPKDASLHAFKAFDKWLAAKTGRPSRQHTSATIRRAADDFSRQANISLQAMYPALGIVLGEVRKNEKAAANKGANMRKRADEKLEVAAPDGRIDVEAPVSDTTDAEAQASQFDLHDFGNNAGDNIADPDLSTDQNWAPGEANKTSKVKTAGGILAFRCAEAMIAAGLEPNTVERKYALAGEFENMNRGLVQDRTALCERFAAVLQDVRRQQVASGSTRGAALQAPVPRNLSQGAQRTAGRGLSPNDPRNDSTMFV